MSKPGTSIAIAGLLFKLLREQQVEIAFGHTVKMVTFWREQGITDVQSKKVLTEMLQSVNQLPSYYHYCKLLKQFANLDLET